jgi:hypothetical protein
MATTWEFGGTDLSTYGRVTVINDYLDLPVRRGDNIVIPHQNGRVFVSKFFDQRKISIGIAVIGTSADDLEETFDDMRAKFSPRTEQLLEMTMEDATVRNAYASVDASMQVQRRSDKIALVVVEFTLSKPYFRLSTAIDDNTLTIDASPHAMTVTNPGTIEERDPTIIITGPFTSMTIANTTNGASLTYTGTIGSGATVTIATVNGEYTAVLSTGSANVIGNVTHSGASALMVFDVGDNVLSITSAGGDNSGTVKATFYAPFA